MSEDKIRRRTRVFHSQVPIDLTYSTLSDRAHRLYAALDDHADARRENAFPSRKRLAELLHTSVKSIDRAMKELIDDGWLSVEKRIGEDGSQRSNLYTVHDKPEPTTDRGDTGDAPLENPTENRGDTGDPRDTGDAPPRDTGDAPPRDTGVPHNKNPSKQEPIYPPEVHQLCDYLAERIGQQRGSTPKQTQTWLVDMDRLLRLGPTDDETPSVIEPVRVRRAIDRTFNELAAPNGNGFCWANQIRSPQALRKHWNSLRDTLRGMSAKPAASDADAAYEIALRAFLEAQRSTDPVSECRRILDATGNPTLWRAMQTAWPAMENKFEAKQHYTAAYRAALTESNAA